MALEIEFLKMRSGNKGNVRFSSQDPKLFVPRSPEMAPTHPSLPVRKSELNFQREPILISRLSGQQELRLTLKQNEAVSGHKGYHQGTPQLKDADIKLCDALKST